MRILHFISHTHWDREWYEPFQVFRIRLARTIDKALDILATDPEYKYFMLDGQIIVLEDYLEIEPDREPELRAHIKTGRILIGPWYILPDEFLVSGEAIIRNLQRGIRIAESFGNCMMIGYIPDPFGHISQMPQLLAGFGIHSAMFRRGLADEQTELWWEGADKTRLLTTYLRDGYDNAAWLARDPEQFAEGLQRLVDSLAPHAVTDHLLMMHGTDHMQPWENLPEVMREAAELVPDVRLIHSNLPAYAQAIEKALSMGGKANLEVVKGELRNPKRHHLLPGVTSTRMWIKQRNARAQVLLERWAEPLAAMAMNLPRAEDADQLNLKPELRLAWKYLLQNHPHDSICGCSADQVHLEMSPRFDWVEQIGDDVVKRSLETILLSINTQLQTEQAVPIAVFNPTAGPRADSVCVQVDLPPGVEQYKIMDEEGISVPFVESGRHVDEYARVTATADDLRWTFGPMKSGRVDGRGLREMAFRVLDRQVQLDITVSDQGRPDLTQLVPKLAELDRYVADPQIEAFRVRIASPVRVNLTFLARNLPGYGYKTFWLMRVPYAQPAPPEDLLNPDWIENEFFRVEPNRDYGTLTITDKTTSAIFEGVNRFVDGGDCGDLYNYCPPEEDLVVQEPQVQPRIEIAERNPLRQTMRIQSVLPVPASLSHDRRSRSRELINLPILTEVTVYAGSHRIDFRTRVQNLARDHRLRVEFPTPIRTAESYAAQAFDIVERETDVPQISSDWVEKPVPTKPMQGYCAIHDGRVGLMVATRGLPEYEVKPQTAGREETGGGESNTGTAPKEGSTIAITLLRCIGWLSRPDLSCRRGDAGPEKPTPGAQELGEYVFEYSIIPYAVGVPRSFEQIEAHSRFYDLSSAHMEALAFSTPLRASPTDMHRGLLPSSANWVQASPSDFVLTAIKPPEEAEGLLVRGFNASDKVVTVHLGPIFPFARAERVNLNEDAIGPIAWHEAGVIELNVKPREIVTVLFQK